MTNFIKNYQFKNFSYTPVEFENFSEGKINQELFNNTIFFSPNIKIIDAVDLKKNFLIINFNAFKGTKISSIKCFSKRNPHLVVNLDYTSIDFSSVCFSELIIDIEEFKILDFLLKNDIHSTYAIHINNPISKEGIINKDANNTGHKNSTGGNTDPIDPYPPFVENINLYK